MLIRFLLAVLLASPAFAADFATRLTPDQRIRHAINRLTFGPRPGDFDQVRKLGVEKWLDLQLHPDRIAENPALAEKLAPLESLRLDTAAILAKYYPQFPPGIPRPVPLNELLNPEQMRRVLNGTAEERRAGILALAPEKRVQVLAMVGPNVLEGLPDLLKEQEAARKKRDEMFQAEMRKLRPPFSELLSADQIRIALRGRPEERSALFASLDPEKLNKIAATLPPNAVDDRPALRRMGYLARNPREAVLADLREAKLYRAIYSNRQLEEVLTDFWFNHFNVFNGKGNVAAMLSSYEREAIRPHVLGKFQDLLLATARHPAMLFYLDNWESMAPGGMDVGPFATGPFASPQQRARQERGINENYGRELLELHTLGVNGGYTQQDVIAVARCFTGWTIKQPYTKPAFVFAGFMHDSGEKTVLGHTIPAGGGENDGLEVIRMLARHPSTARFISTKLARRFVADEPPAALIDRMARVFLKTDGDLRAVMEAMFTSREFFSTGAWEAKVKSPLEVVVSAVRALDADTVDTYVLAQRVAEMGQPLYAKEPPTGYKDTADAWLSTANVLARINFANTLMNGGVHGLQFDTAKLPKDGAAIARDLLGRDPDPQTLSALEKTANSPPHRMAAVVLSAPEFQRR